VVNVKTRVVAVRLPEELVSRLDELVKRGVFRSRNDAIKKAVELLISVEENVPTTAYR
jgi:Arc/MetJ-type ribon-helix-helix transcriptional regulator